MTALLLLLPLASPVARASDGCTPVPLPAVEALVEQQRVAIYAEDDAALALAIEQVHAGVPCLVDVVPPELWARHLVSLSIRAYAQNQDWQTPLGAALVAWPTVDRLVGTQHPIARWDPPPAPPAQDPLPAGVEVYLDGRRVAYAQPLRGLHLVQAVRGEAVRGEAVRGEAVRGEAVQSWLVQGDGTPAAWPAIAPPPSAERPLTSTPPPTPPDRAGAGAWLVSGALVGVAGAGVGIGTWAARDAAETPGAQAGFVAGNTAGWGLALVGGGLLGVGVARALDGGPRLRLGPGLLVVEGVLP